MPKIDVHLESVIARDFRVEQVAGMFDVPLQDKAQLNLSVHLPPIEGPGSDWRVACLVGSSGSGKSSVARAAYPDRFIEAGGFTWPEDRAIVSAFDADLEMKQITGTLHAVGFSTPPAWVLPYRCLSTGQRMRCDLARALLRDEPVLAFDEFTSVVDRQVGRFASAAVAKAIRGRRVPLQRFVAVTCHADVIEWLEPDWVLDMESGQLIAASRGVKMADLPRGCLRRCKPWKRPTIEIEIRLGPKRLWRVFGVHHYLSAKLHPASRCYFALWEGVPVAMCATLANAGHKGRRIVHRLVVLPDYQGMGIGIRLLDAVCGIEAVDGKTMSIRTSHPALIASLRSREGWRCSQIVRGGDKHHGKLDRGTRHGSLGRAVATFSYRPGSGTRRDESASASRRSVRGR